MLEVTKNKKNWCDDCIHYCTFQCERYGCGTSGTEAYEYDCTPCREFNDGQEDEED